MNKNKYYIYTHKKKQIAKLEQLEQSLTVIISNLKGRNE